MSEEVEKINLVKLYLYPFKFTNNKTLIVNFLTEVYANIYYRCNNNFDSYTFQEVINLPMIISDKIFLALTKNKIITLNKFSTGIYDLFFFPIDKKIELIFDILDFDKDKVINKYDVFLILSHFHLIDNSSDLIILLENLLDNFFEESNILSKDDLINFCKTKNTDIFFLMIFFLNAYINLIRDDELKQYGLSINYSKFENSENSNNNNFCDYKNLLNYKVTNYLINYLSKITISNVNLSKIKVYINKIYKSENDEKNISSEEDNEELEDLNNFENDMIDCIIGLSKPINIEPKSFEIKGNESDIHTTTFSKDDSYNSPEKYSKKITFNCVKSNFSLKKNL